MSNIIEYLEKLKEETDNYLKEILSHEITPILLGEAVRYAMFGGGKRIRAILAITICRLLQGKDENIFPFAGAIECIHCYSLVHDDLPAMDNDDYRRGRLSTHKKFGEAMGILTGDALLTHAFWILAAKTKAKDVVAPLVENLAWLAGIGGMVAGQSADILQERKAPWEDLLGKEKSTQDLLAYIHNNKTAALICCACKAGAIAAYAKPEEILKVAEYGIKIGLAFQIEDDILDVTGSQEKMGKKVGKDQASGKLTYPMVYGLEKAKEKAETLVKEAYQAISFIPDNVILQDIANFIVHRDY
ncbi:MAG: polyprenyl synthetase family protein [Candidatus Brocadiae bacterium]|nr:polyprenyl synthetase family protein [Candidatus Brocadiia bacterium]